MGPTGGGWVGQGLRLGRFGPGLLHVNSNVYPSLVPRDGRAESDAVGTRAGRVPTCRLTLLLQSQEGGQ